MAKIVQSYGCNACGNLSTKWAGQCEACNEWNTIELQTGAVGATPKGMSRGKGNHIKLVSLDSKLQETPRRAVGISELDRVLGGGLVAGSAVLIGGDPGIGKSTLLLQVAARCTQLEMRCAYFSGEESTGQIQLRAQRLGLEDAKVELATASSVRDILATLQDNTPDLIIIDSIQTMFVDNIDAAPGTVSQVRACANELIRFAKTRNCALFLVGHVTKDGQIAGPRVLEHMVDTVLYFEGERGHEFRILRAVKNRFGGTDEIGVFEMRDTGLQEITNPSALFLSERDTPVSGTAIFAGMEGTRPIMVEIQALLAPSNMANPRRAVVGWDAGRLSMLLAVLETRCGISLHDKEVYLSIAGGITVKEPAADLAVAAAILSALSDVAVPDGMIYFGELGLSGEIRKVSRGAARLKEAEKLGFTKATCPKLTQKTTLSISTVAHIKEMLD